MGYVYTDIAQYFECNSIEYGCHGIKYERVVAILGNGLYKWRVVETFSNKKYHSGACNSNHNHGKTKSATLQKRNVIFKAKTKCTKITEKATHLSGFFHLFKRYLNNIQKEQYIV